MYKRQKQGRGEPCGAGDIRGTAAVGDGGAQSRLGGMVNGVPEAMDGFKLWEREPVGVPRITDRTDGRACLLYTSADWNYTCSLALRAV